MSRSRRRTKIFGVSKARSEKFDKQVAHRAERRVVKMRLHAGDDDMPHPKEMFEPWVAAKDGKVYWADARAKDMRK